MPTLLIIDASSDAKQIPIVATLVVGPMSGSIGRPDQQLALGPGVDVRQAPSRRGGSSGSAWRQDSATVARGPPTRYPRPHGRRAGPDAALRPGRAPGRARRRLGHGRAGQHLDPDRRAGRQRVGVIGIRDVGGRHPRGPRPHRRDRRAARCLGERVRDRRQAGRRRHVDLVLPAALGLGLVPAADPVDGDRRRPRPDRGAVADRVRARHRRRR